MNTLNAVALLAWLALPVAQPAMAAVPDSDAVQWRQQALALEHGEGVPRNLTAAAALYCKAAVAGDSQAQYRLGLMYTNGSGMVRSDAQHAWHHWSGSHQAPVCGSGRN